MNLDNAGGGRLTGPLTNSVFINNMPVAVIGCQVMPHPCCGSEGCDGHCSARMVEGSNTVFANNIGIVRSGDMASCGHVSTGSSNVYVE